LKNFGTCDHVYTVGMKHVIEIYVGFVTDVKYCCDELFVQDW